MIESKRWQSVQTRARAAIGTGTLLLAGALQAQAPAQAPGAATPSARPPARSPAPASAPQVIRPSATLGPAAPGATGTPASTPPGPATAAPVGAAPAGQQAAAAAGTPRLPGVARYRSVARPNAVMYDAPSDKAKKIFLAPEGMPVEVISVLRTWVKVRDPLGDLAWISRDDLNDRRMVMATSVAVLRREAESNAPLWFRVDRGVLLELLEEKPVNGFLKVRYAEGQVGYIQPDQVWGL